LDPEEIARQILDLANWTAFKGYGLLPGIKSAKFEMRAPDVVGSRIRVQDTDGSTHVEEIVEWRPDCRVCLEMTDFSPPLGRLATRFLETWEFKRQGNGTLVTRSFELYAKSAFTRLPLWAISLLLRRAIVRQLKQMRSA
jgi:hypothetical protein